VRHLEFALVRRAADILRVIAGDGFPRSVLSAKQWRGMCARGILQFHPPEGSQRGARSGSSAEHEEVVEGPWPGCEECQSQPEPGADEATVLVEDLISGLCLALRRHLSVLRFDSSLFCAAERLDCFCDIRLGIAFNL
jgi:hypothetical protein